MVLFSLHKFIYKTSFNVYFSLFFDQILIKIRPVKGVLFRFINLNMYYKSVRINILSKRKHGTIVKIIKSRVLPTHPDRYGPVSVGSFVTIPPSGFHPFQ